MPDFTRKGQITFPVLKKKDGEPIYVKIISEIYTGKEIKQAQGKKKMEPARLAKVVNLETGEQMELICNRVLESNLNENTGDDRYVGKCFEIVQQPSRQGKQYKTFSIWELECPGEAPPTKKRAAKE